ncbi:MAG: LytTR family DNA-binding domain-containing protein [Aliishimia sp.]
MKRPFLQFAKHEIQRFFAPRGVWVATVAAGVLLGIIGPFGTDTSIGVAPRILYWILVASLTFLTGTVLGTYFIQRGDASGWPRWLSIICATVVSGTVIFLEILGTGLILFQSLPKTITLTFLATNIYIAVGVITITYEMLAPNLPAVEKPPRLLERLPQQKRGALISISVSDHYVNVTTTLGTQMILLRFGDAIVETAPTPGMQIHRSHWVALDQIKSIQRKNGKTYVELPDDQRLPVSRTYLPILKDAGFMPKSSA